MQWVQYVRTHVDVSDPTLTALKAMLESQKRNCTLGRFTDCSISTRRYFVLSNGEKLLDQAMEMGADVVGGIPHFEFTREYGVESMHIAF